MRATVAAHGARTGIGALCAALALPPSTYYRARARAAAPPTPATRRAPPPRTLRPDERA